MHVASYRYIIASGVGTGRGGSAVVLVEERVLLEVEVMVVLAMAQLHNTHCIRLLALYHA